MGGSRFLTFLAFVLVVIASSAVTVTFMGGGGVGGSSVEKAVADYIAKNPEAIANAMQQAQQAQQIKQQQAAQRNIKGKIEDLENDPGTPFAGNEEGDVTIVEFFDYNCGYCKRVVPDIAQLLEEDDNVKFVFKEFPILGPASKAASQAAIAVWQMDKEKYWDFHQALMKVGARNEEAIFAEAKKLGIDEAKLKEKMASSEVEEQLNKHTEIGRAIGVRGTPTFIVAGSLQRGAMDVGTMKSLVAEARK